MIIGYFGNVRQGKTLSAVREIKKFYDLGYKIYSNTWLNFKYTPLTNDYILDIIEKDLDLPDNSLFFIDEIYMFGLDSRSSMTKKNQIMTWFLLQTGKLGKNTDYGLILVFTCQFPHQCDRRLRSVIDIAINCEKIEYHNKKYFVQTAYIYKGEKSFSFKRYFIAGKSLYNLYDTRKKIAMQKDRYMEE